MEQDWPWLPWILSSCMVIQMPISLMLVEVHHRVSLLCPINFNTACLDKFSMRVVEAFKILPGTPT